MLDGKTKMTGGDVRDMRDRMFLTQEEFAREIGVTVSTVNRWENGHCDPSRLACDHIREFAKRRGVSPS